MSKYNSTTINDMAYVCLTSMIRAKEAHMLTREKAEAMLAAPGFAECCAITAACGYPDMSSMRIPEMDAVLAAKLSGELEELSQTIPDPVLLKLFQLKFDYHNAKVITKSQGKETQLLSPNGTINKDELLDCYLKQNLLLLPPVLAQAMDEAAAVLARTGNPALSDAILDRAYLGELTNAAGDTDMLFIKDYVRLLIDATNLKTIVRCQLAGKRPELIPEYLFDGGSVTPESLKSALNSPESLKELFKAAGLGDGVQALGSSRYSMTDFERSVDNCIGEFLSDAELIGFGPAAVLSYLSALETEVMNLRVILTGRVMGIAGDTLKERLREIYV